MLDFLHGDRCGVRITEDDHADGIANEENGNTDFVEETGHGKIVGRQRGDFLAAFHRADLIGRDAIHYSRKKKTTNEHEWTRILCARQIRIGWVEGMRIVQPWFDFSPMMSSTQE